MHQKLHTYILKITRLQTLQNHYPSVISNNLLKYTYKKIVYCKWIWGGQSHKIKEV